MLNHSSQGKREHRKTLWINSTNSLDALGSRIDSNHNPRMFCACVVVARATPKPKSIRSTNISDSDCRIFLLLGTLVVLTLTLVHCNQLKKPATTLKKPPAPKEVSDQQRLILMFLSTSPPSLVGEIAAGSSIRGKVELCMYHLEELEKVDFIYGDKSFEGRHWKLKQAGRKYLVDKKLLT